VDHGLPEGIARRLGPAGRFGVRETLAGLAVALVGIPFGLLLQQVTTHGPLTVLDESAAEWLHKRLIGNAAATNAMRTISFTGKPIFLIVLVGVPALWAWRQGARKLATFLVVTSIGGAIVDSLVKAVVGRPRPKFDEPIATAIGKSFPSGHSMSSLICYGAVLLVVMPLIALRWRRVALAATGGWVLLIGVSRLALGVHFLSDVLGGYALGAAWLVGSVAAFETWRIERGKRPTHPLEEGVEPEESDAIAP
jgi:undecaprenyl-diphosphatase